MNIISYASIVGSLMYSMVCMRPHITYKLWHSFHRSMKFQTLASSPFPYGVSYSDNLAFFLHNFRLWQSFIPLRRQLQNLAFILYAYRFTDSGYLFQCLYSYKLWHHLSLPLQSFRLWHSPILPCIVKTMTHCPTKLQILESKL